MEKRSRHYGDVQRWIEKVIDSCETYDQTRSARRLIWNFEKQMVKNKVGGNIAYTIGAHLRDVISNKMVEIREKYLES
jgi:hypothetical protein